MNRVAVIGLAGQSAFMGVERFHTGGETIVAKDFHLEFGGKGFNQAVAAARHGARVSFLGAIGERDFDDLSSLCQKESIKPFLAKKDCPSPYASIITDESGETHVTVAPGDALLDSMDLDVFKDEIAKCDVLLLTNETPQKVNEEAIAWAKKCGAYVILNPAPYRDLSGFILRETDLFTPNESENRGLEAAKETIVTLGKMGCRLGSSGRRYGAKNFGKAIDATGAGDTFNGVLAAMLARKEKLDAAIEAALEAAGKSVTKRYVLNAIPYLRPAANGAPEGSVGGRGGASLGLV